LVTIRVPAIVPAPLIVSALVRLRKLRSLSIWLDPKLEVASVSWPPPVSETLLAISTKVLPVAWFIAMMPWSLMVPFRTRVLPSVTVSTLFAAIAVPLSVSLLAGPAAVSMAPPAPVTRVPPLMVVL
jgi:hypothetical protein